MSLTETELRDLVRVFGPAPSDFKLAVAPDSAKLASASPSARAQSKYDPASRIALAELAEQIGPTAASRSSGVPHTTISYWMHAYRDDPERLATEVHSGGRSTALSAEQEAELRAWVVSDSDGVSCNELCAEAQQRFGEDVEGLEFSRGWAAGFAKRHKLSLRLHLHRTAPLSATAN